MLLVKRVSPARSRPLQGDTAAGAKILSVGIASTGVVTFAYFSVASHALNDPDAYTAISLLWSVLFVIVSVIYRPIEQLLSRTIADRRARGFEADHPLRTPMLIQAGVRAHVPGRRADLPGPDPGRAVRRLRRAVLGAGRRGAGLRGELLRARLAGRAPVVRALRRRWCSSRRRRGCCSRSRCWSGSPRGSPWSRWAWPRRRSSRSSSSRSRSRAGRRRARASSRTRRRSASPAAGASPSPCCASCSPSRRCSTRGVIAADLTATDAAVAGYVFNALLIARAPLQLFQAVQGSLLPHLAGLEANAGQGGVRARRSGSRSSPSRASRGAVAARAAGARPVRDGPAVRRRQDLRPVRARRGRARDGRPPRRGHAQPGRARPRPRRRRRDRVAA